MTRFAAVPLTLTVLALGLAACGGDDAPSKADFAADAEEICKNAEKQLENVGQDAKSPKEIAAAVDEVIDEMQGSVDELQDLDQPEGAAGEQAERFVSAVQSDIEEKGIPPLRDLRDALEKNDEQAARKAAERLQAVETTQSNKLASEIGADACGN
jgi:hypothetical protein